MATEPKVGVAEKEAPSTHLSSQHPAQQSAHAGGQQIAQSDAQQPADGGGGPRLDDELAADVLPLGPQGFADADLPGALGDGDQHDVHNADAAHQQGDGGDGHQHADGHAHHGVDEVGLLLHGLGEIGVRVPLEAVIEHTVDDLLGLGGGLAGGAGEDVQGHIPGSHEFQGVFIGDVDLVIWSALQHLAGAQLIQHADDGVGRAVDGQSLSQGVPPKGLLGQIGPNDAHVAPPLHIQEGEETPGGQLLSPVHGGLGLIFEHDLADAVQLGLVEFLVPPAQGGLEGDVWGRRR